MPKICLVFDRYQDGRPVETGIQEDWTLPSIANAMWFVGSFTNHPSSAATLRGYRFAQFSRSVLRKLDDWVEGSPETSPKGTHLVITGVTVEDARPEEVSVEIVFDGYFDGEHTAQLRQAYAWASPQEAMEAVASFVNLRQPMVHVDYEVGTGRLVVPLARHCVEGKMPTSWRASTPGEGQVMPGSPIHGRYVVISRVGPTPRD